MSREDCKSSKSRHSFADEFDTGLVAVLFHTYLGEDDLVDL